MIVKPRCSAFLKSVALAVAMATASSVHGAETTMQTQRKIPGLSISRSTCGFMA